ncbi:MAG: phage tail protein [Pyrinomonadaceae bacterium]|nr:phage tail protein [Pyrinomonadaceae bacterium]
MPRVDPHRNFQFLVQIDGFSQASFSECSGLASEIAVIEYREGGEATSVRKLPGRVSFHDLTLKRGVTNSRELYDWHLAGLQGQVDRRNVAIILLDEASNEVARWRVFNAWPHKWEGPNLSATANEVAMETLTLTCEGIQRD